MSKHKPFHTDLAQWSAEYLKDRIQEIGLTISIIPDYDSTGLIIERYNFTFRDTWQDREYGANVRYTPYELIEAYKTENLDSLAKRFVFWVNLNIERLKREDHE